MTVTDSTAAKIEPALLAFVSTFSAPAIDEDHVLWGANSGQTAPSDGNDFALVWITGATRRGTGVEDWDEDEDGADEQEIASYVELAVQIDSFSTDLFSARQRTQVLETVARSHTGCDFFRDYGVDLLYAESPRDLTGVFDSHVYQSRWSLTLRIGFWSHVTVEQEFFTAVNLNLIEVDSRFGQQPATGA